MLFSRKKTAPTTDTVKITTETQIKETPSKSDTVIEVIKATTKSLMLRLVVSFQAVLTQAMFQHILQTRKPLR